MAFTVKNWQDLPSTATPLSAAALEDLEARVTAYADSITVSGSDPNAVSKTLLDAKGDLLSATSNDTPTRVGIPSPFGPDGAQLVTDSSLASGLRWSVKSADYNIVQAGATPVFTDTTTANNNTVAIQAAMDAAAADGRPLIIPPCGGPFYHTGQLLMPTGLHVRGFGKDRSCLKVHSSVNKAPGFEFIRNKDAANGNDNITLENFELDGNRSGRGGVLWDNQTAGIGIGYLQFRAPASSPCRNIRLLNMSIHSATGVGTGATGVNNYLIQGCEIYDHARDACGLLAANGGECTNVRYIGNYIYGCGDDFISLGSSSTVPNTNITVVGNVLGPHPAYDGVAPAGYGGHGVEVGGCTDVTIAGNVFVRNAYAAVCVNDHPLTGSARINISGNTMLTPGWAHLPAGVTTSGHAVEFKSADGFAITDVIFANNIVQSPMSHCILFQTHGAGRITGVRLTGNDFLGGVGSNYEANGTGIFVNNIAGSGVNLNPVGQVQVIGNRFRDLRGRVIDGNSQKCQLWQISNNFIYSNLKGSPGADTGAIMDLTNFEDVTVSHNKVLDPAGTRNAAYTIAVGGVVRGRILDNDFVTSARTATLVGTPTSLTTHDNINNAGTLMEGTPATVGVLA